MRRVHRQHRAAGGCVAAFQYQRPGLAAIRRLVDAALVAVAPELSGDAHVDGAGLVGIDEDLDDVLGLAQPHVGPVFAAVFRPVDAVTAPIDCTGCRSKTGLNVVPPFTDFHTPPLAEPT